MEPKFNLWIENNGNVVMSLWRANFLQAIAATNSLKEAADRMNMTYSEAVDKLEEMEKGLGFKVVTAHPEDESKETVRLTPEGKQILEQFQKFSSGFAEEVSKKFSNSFSNKG